MNPKIAKEAEAVEFGCALRNFGLNLLVRDVAATVLFLKQVLHMKTHRSDHDFAVVESRGTYFQLHADHTYHSNPLPSLIPQAGNRGAGIEMRLMRLILTLVKKGPESVIMLFSEKVRIGRMV